MFFRSSPWKQETALNWEFSQLNIKLKVSPSTLNCQPLIMIKSFQDRYFWLAVWDYNFPKTGQVILIFWFLSSYSIWICKYWLWFAHTKKLLSLPLTLRMSERTLQSTLQYEHPSSFTETFLGKIVTEYRICILKGPTSAFTIPKYWMTTKHTPIITIIISAPLLRT